MKFNLVSNKKVVSFFGVIGICASLFAYNPPIQGENLTTFVNPNQMSAGFSVAGGALFNVTPTSVTINPALGAYQNRIVLDFGYTGIITGVDDNPYSQAFGTGILIPTKWCNVSAEFFGIFSTSEKMQLGNSVNLKTTVSKEVAENLAIGVGVGFGGLWGIGEDWNLVLDAGAVYKWGQLGPMKNFRLAASVLNLGKVFNHNTSMGIYGKNHSDQWSTYPGFLTVKAGAAAEFINKKDFILGLAVDVSSPFFQNVIVDAGVQMKMFDVVKLSSSWQFDFQTCLAGKPTLLPTVGLSFVFGLDTSFTKKESWKKSDLEIGTAWKNVYDNVNAISVGGIINVGQPDRAAPEITVDADVEVEE